MERDGETSVFDKINVFKQNFLEIKAYSGY